MKSPATAFDEIARDLIGMPVNHIWQGHGTALFLEFGVLTEESRAEGAPGNPRGEISVGLEFDWRIERNSDVVCGSHDDPAGCADVIHNLKGKRATRLDVRGEIPELVVELDNEVRLLSFALSEVGPEWSVTDNRFLPPIWVYWANGALTSDDGSSPS